MEMPVTLFSAVFLSFVASSAAANGDLPDPRTMMWPIPGNYSFQGGIIALVDRGFEIVGDGPGKSSPLLKRAFERYKQYFFDHGQGSATSGLRKLTVYAGDASEVQTLDTSEFCTFIFDHSLC